MAKINRTWRYSISVGLRGCYMPRSMTGPYTGETRRELAELIRDKLRMLDAPASAFRQVNKVNIRRLWNHIKNHGSSGAHFAIDIGRGEEIAFHGLTEQEANEGS